MKKFTKHIALILSLVIVISLSGCLKYTSNILDVTNKAQESTTLKTPGVTSPNVTLPSSQTTTAPDASVSTTAADNTQNTTSPSVEQTTASQVENTTVATISDPSLWSKEEVVAYYVKAVNTTKAYTGALNVTHSESFSANITECTGGSLIAKAANGLVEKVVKPVTETMNFSGGKAVNSEGETVPILLPSSGNCTLSASGVTSASAVVNGNNIVVTIKLVGENCGLNDKPVHNASAIGYLDIASLDISVVTITSAEIDYTGSEITATINDKGYVTHANYNIPLHVKGGGKAMGLTGNATFDGGETEDWTLNW